MTQHFSFTREQLLELLDEFSEFWESEWLNEDCRLDGDDGTASEYFLRRKMLDPLFPDRPPQVR